MEITTNFISHMFGTAVSLFEVMKRFIIWYCIGMNFPEKKHKRWKRGKEKKCLRHKHTQITSKSTVWINNILLSFTQPTIASSELRVQWIIFGKKFDLAGWKKMENGKWEQILWFNLESSCLYFSQIFHTNAVVNFSIHVSEYIINWRRNKCFGYFECMSGPKSHTRHTIRISYRQR